MKEKILKITLQMLEKEGFASFSMRRLALKLKIDAMAIYYYFPKKEVLLSELTESVFLKTWEKKCHLWETIPLQTKGKPIHRNIQKAVEAMARVYHQLFIQYPGLSFYLLTLSQTNSVSLGIWNKTFLSLLSEVMPPKEAQLTKDLLVDFIHGASLPYVFQKRPKLEMKRKLEQGFQKELQFFLRRFFMNQ